MTNNTALKLPDISGFYTVGFLCTLLPNSVSFFAFFGGTTRGIYVGVLFWLPVFVLFVSRIFMRKQMHRPVRRSLAVCVCLTGLALLVLAFMSLPPSYLGAFDGLLWAIWCAQILALGAGVSAGLIKHDATALALNLRKRHKIEPGRIVERKRPDAVLGYRKTTGFLLFDWLMRIVFYVYAGFLVLGMALGGGAPLIILRLIEPYFATDAALDKHVSGMLGLGMVFLPLIGYYLPGLWRYWHGIKEIEREAEDENGHMVYVWKD